MKWGKYRQGFWVTKWNTAPSCEYLDKDPEGPGLCQLAPQTADGARQTLHILLVQAQQVLVNTTTRHSCSKVLTHRNSSWHHRQLMEHGRLFPMHMMQSCRVLNNALTFKHKCKCITWVPFIYFLSNLQRSVCKFNIYVRTTTSFHCSY